MSATITRKLAGKVALVTGGSRGIGAAIARRLAADDAAVAMTYSSSPKPNADEVVRSIEAKRAERPWRSKQMPPTQKLSGWRFAENRRGVRGN